jgi:hypothetical protein
MVPIGAINDGCLQIQVPDSATGGRMFWSRQYYVIPLEVSYASLSPVPVFLCPFSMFQTDGIVGNRHSRYSSRTPLSGYIPPSSPSHLKSRHDTGTVGEEIQLSASRSYDVCDPNERGYRLDVLIAMVEYLRRGESKVG